MSEVLGKISFQDTPDVNGQDVLINSGGVPTISSGTLAARPAAGLTGRLYLDTTNNVFYRDNGASWDNLTALIQVLGTVSQVAVTPAVVGTPPIIGLADNPVVPGNGGMVLPNGSTAQRGTSSTGNIRFNNTLGYAETYNGSVWQPLGRVIQYVTGTIAASSGTVTVPLDNTVPTSTEGNQIWTVSFTPLSAASRINVRFTITHSSSLANATNICSVFNGTTNVGSSMSRAPATANTPDVMTCDFTFASSGVSSTISARLGGSANATTYCNQLNTVTLGGAAVTSYTITEVI